MELENYKVIKNFINDDEVKIIIEWVDKLNHLNIQPNHHLDVLSKSLNGNSFIFDISKTSFTEYITNFQAISSVSKDNPPSFIIDILERISVSLGIPKNHTFLQVVDMKSGGKINPHYDASIDGYINYKCNLSVLSEDFNIFIGENTLSVNQKDLYCFEASLYKHWTNQFNSRRVMLSFGFIIPYEIMGRSESDPRVRLSKRIEKYFQRNYDN